jgi:hypothetical protein
MEVAAIGRAITISGSRSFDSPETALGSKQKHRMAIEVKQHGSADLVRRRTANDGSMPNSDQWRMERAHGARQSVTTGCDDPYRAAVKCSQHDDQNDDDVP